MPARERGRLWPADERAGQDVRPTASERAGMNLAGNPGEKVFSAPRSSWNRTNHTPLDSGGNRTTIGIAVLAALR